MYSRHGFMRKSRIRQRKNYISSFGFNPLFRFYPCPTSFILKKQRGRQGLPHDDVHQSEFHMDGYFVGCGAGACAGGITGDVCSCFTPSMTELFFDWVNASVNEVSIKMIAAPVVSFDKKLCAPRGPNTV